MSVRSYAGLNVRVIQGQGGYTMPAGRVGWVTYQQRVVRNGGCVSSRTDATDFTGHCEIRPGDYVSRSSGGGLVDYDQCVSSSTATESGTATFAAETFVPGGGGSVYDNTQTHTAVAGNTATQGQHFTVTVPPGMTHLYIQTLNGGPGDSDLFLMVPGHWNNDASEDGINPTYNSESSFMDEYISVTNPPAGVWDIVYCPYNQPTPENYDLRIAYDNIQPDSYSEAPWSGPFVLDVPENALSLTWGITNVSSPSEQGSSRIHVYPPGCWNGDVGSSTEWTVSAFTLTGTSSLQNPIGGPWTFVIEPVRMTVEQTLTFEATAVYGCVS